MPLGLGRKPGQWILLFEDGKKIGSILVSEIRDYDTVHLALDFPQSVRIERSNEDRDTPLEAKP